MAAPCRPPARGDAERGAAAVEYALVASLIAAVIVVTVGLLGGDVSALFETAADAFPG